MIYFTGDTHGDTQRLSKAVLKPLKENDTLIICGDFGFLWDGGSAEKKFIDKLSKRKYNICFIDGTHENFDLLNSCPVSEWNGGKVHRIGRNVYHLLRGQIYNIDGETVFTMGGGENPDYELKDDDEISSHAEIPTKEQMLDGVGKMEKNGFKIDYIVTHEPPARVRDFLMLSENKTLRVTALGAYFDELASQCEYKRWVFGSMHIDKYISGIQTALFKYIISAETGDRIY